MAKSYVKIWTDIEDDEWFLSLSCLERGLWLQMLVRAKAAGDSGEFSWRNPTQAAQHLGCDGKTLRKFLGKIQEKSAQNPETGGRFGAATGKILDNSRTLVKTLDSGVLRITLLNYDKWQRDAKAGQRTPVADKSEKNPPIIRPDKIRPDKTRADVKSDLSQVLDYYNLRLKEISETSFCRDVLTANETKEFHDCLKDRSVENMCHAIDGCFGCTHNRQGKHLAFGTIFKPEKIGRYIALVDNPEVDDKGNELESKEDSSRGW